MVDLIPDAVGAGERKRNNRRIACQFAAHRASVADNNIERALGQPGIGQRFGQFKRHSRRLRCRLDDDGVARNQRRGHFPGRNGDGEIPGRDQGNHAQGLTARVEQLLRQIVRDGLAAERVAEPAKKSENVDGPLHFAGAFRQRLALLAGEDFGQLHFP